MPSFVPRSEPVKKREELSKRKKELRHALRNNFVLEKIIKAAEKYRKAQLSLLKATTHVAQDKEFKNQPNNLKIESIENKIMIWENKTAAQIIDEFKDRPV
jgi:hypothetical protein